MVSYYDYQELHDKVTAGDDGVINDLGEWFSRFGASYWNGECFDADDFRIKPIYSEPDEYGDCDVIGFERI